MNNIINPPANLTRNDVLSDFDSLFGNYMHPLRIMGGNGNSSRTPAIDVVEKDKEYELRAELPGIKKEDLNVAIKDGVLTINAQTKSEHTEEKEGRIVRQERHLGQYVRSLRLGHDIDESKVDANYTDGVLTLVIEKLEEVQPKKIQIKF